MRYILLLRGINVGGKNKVVMSELKALLERLNFKMFIPILIVGIYFLVVLIHLIFVFAKSKIC